jgi:serine/threonine-protein kinase
MQLKRLGPYEIEKPLGKGGMGSVYAATDTQTGQRVAIKALTPHLAMAEGFRERFEAEIESLKTLRHEGIVRLYGYGEENGVLFYSMELVDGISLEDELRAGRRFNWREVTHIAIQLSLALKHAHDHGIVHRDIKPANILLYDEDHVKLADFGIARLFGMTQLTTAGGVLGTADYMSPEQAEGRPVTARCDQYSLGGVMYALLAGRPPFLAQNLPQMLQLQRFAKPDPVRRYAPETPEQLEGVISQLLEKDPASRFPNTQVLARHLQAMARALSRPATDDLLPAADEDLEHDAPPGGSSASGATRADSADGREPLRTGQDSRSAASDAATVAADDLPLLRPPTAVRARDVTVPPSQAAVQPLIERPARFTTLEEEEARRRAENRRPWPLVAAQLAALGAVLAGIAAGAIYVSRPPSADKLYQTITSSADREDEASLANVANEIEEFLALYPHDSRAGELRKYERQIELDRLERKLSRQARGGDALHPSLLPVEQLYLQAHNRAESAPEESAELLQSLIDLYGPKGGEEKDDQAADVVRLAKRRLTLLREQIAEQHKRQLASLSERLDAAERLLPTNAEQAAAMYRAIVDLHGSDAWAGEVVAQARARLEQMENRDREARAE